MSPADSHSIALVLSWPIQVHLLFVFSLHMLIPLLIAKLLQLPTILTNQQLNQSL